MTSRSLPNPEYTAMTESSEKHSANDEMASTLEVPHPYMERLKPEGEIASDPESGERATREKLKKTSINALPKYKIVDTEPRPGEAEDEIMFSQQPDVGEEEAEEAGTLSSDEGRGRPTKKRSFDDLQVADQGHESLDSPSKQYDLGHTRKKSREARISHGHEEPGIGRAASETGSLQEEDSHTERAQNATADVEDQADLSNTVQDAPLEEGQPMEADRNEPKKKRSRDQFDNDDDKELKVSEASNGAPVEPAGELLGDEDATLTGLSRKTTGEPDKKRHRDSSLESLLPREEEGNAAKRLSTTGFGNTSATSPFASLDTSKSIFRSAPKVEKEEPQDQPKTSSSAFAASGFAALSGSEKSPFGALGSSTGNAQSVLSGFGGLVSSNPPLSSFGSSTTKSAFGGPSPFAATSQSGFGKLGGGGFGGGGGLSSFASSGGSGLLKSGAKPVRPFGAPAQEANDSGDEDETSEGGGDNEEHHEDDRFFEQKVETGEEGEETIFSCKAKLLYNDGKQWKERGMGTFKLNVTEPPFEDHDEETHKRTARLIMRSEGVFRVILNAPVFKGMKVGNVEGKKPEGKAVWITVVEHGKPVPLVLKTGNAKYTEDFYNKIQELEELL